MERLAGDAGGDLDGARSLTQRHFFDIAVADIFEEAKAGGEELLTGGPFEFTKLTSAVVPIGSVPAEEVSLGIELTLEQAGLEGMEAIAPAVFGGPLFDGGRVFAEGGGDGGEGAAVAELEPGEEGAEGARGLAGMTGEGRGRVRAGERRDGGRSQRGGRSHRGVDYRGFDVLYFFHLIQHNIGSCRRKRNIVFIITDTIMKTKANESIRELRRILGQTQQEFAAMIGASKDTVVSWETGRNKLSAGMARRIAFTTGVDEESMLAGRGMPTVTMPVLGRRGYTAEDYARYGGTTKGRSDEAGARHHLKHCEDTLELLLLAAARAGRGRLPGVLHSFIEWSEGVRKEFELGAAIDEQLERRKSKAGVTLTQGEWRRLARTEAARLRAMGFKDDPRKGGEEPLRLEVEVRPGWAPGRRMQLPNAAVVEVVVEGQGIAK